jgi:hypothetical protein
MKRKLNSKPYSCYNKKELEGKKGDEVDESHDVMFPTKNVMKASLNIDHIATRRSLVKKTHCCFD